MTMVNNVIGMVNYVIAARASLRNFMIADMPAPRPSGTPMPVPALLGQRRSVSR